MIGAVFLTHHQQVCYSCNFCLLAVWEFNYCDCDVIPFCRILFCQNGIWNNYMAKASFSAHLLGKFVLSTGEKSAFFAPFTLFLLQNGQNSCFCLSNRQKARQKTQCLRQLRLQWWRAFSVWILGVSRRGGGGAGGPEGCLRRIGEFGGGGLNNSFFRAGILGAIFFRLRIQTRAARRLNIRRALTQRISPY